MVHLIFVHGVNTQNTGYSNPLFAAVLQVYQQGLRQEGLTAGQAQDRGKNLIQHEIMWAQETTDLTNRYESLEYEIFGRKGMWNFLGKVVDPLVIQILFYVKDKGHKKGPMRILKSFDESVRQLELKPKDKVIFISHSLGSVITYDYLFGFRKYRLTPRQKVEGFFSMGSPIPIFSAAMGYPENNVRLPARVKRWINILDPDDGVSRYCQRHYTKLKVEDVEVNTGWTPIGAHVAYWKSEQTARVIANRLRDWKL
jgi:hypothetical protein